MRGAAPYDIHSLCIVPRNVSIVHCHPSSFVSARLTPGTDSRVCTSLVVLVVHDDLITRLFAHALYAMIFPLILSHIQSEATSEFSTLESSFCLEPMLTVSLFLFILFHGATFWFTLDRGSMRGSSACVCGTMTHSLKEIHMSRQPQLE